MGWHRPWPGSRSDRQHRGIPLRRVRDRMGPLGLSRARARRRSLGAWWSFGPPPRDGFPVDQAYGVAVLVATDPVASTRDVTSRSILGSVHNARWSGAVQRGHTDAAVIHDSELQCMEMGVDWGATIEIWPSD